MRKRIVAFLVFFTLLAAAPYTAAASSFTTDSFHADIKVSEDNSWIVKETIQMNFDGGHGIYRYIPYTGKIYYSVNGEETEQPYCLKIKDVSIPGYDYSESYENNCIVFRVGREDTVLYGPQTYEINYRAVGHEDGTDALDQVYLNISPGEWNTEISNVSFDIQMPRDFDSEQVEFITGYYGTVDTERVSWTREGNTIHGVLNGSLAAGETVTLRIVLPEGYFVGERTNGWMIGLLWALIAGAALVSALLWFFFGRDPHVVKTVEFYPPDGINSAELGYIIDGTVDDKDLISMILCFANRGYLTIEEAGKKDFVFHKVKPLPAGAKPYEIIMFNGLFQHGDHVNLKSLEGEFFPHFTDAKNALRKHFTKIKENRIFTESSMRSRGFSCLLLLIPFGAFAFLGPASQFRSLFESIFLLPSLVLALLGFSVGILTFDKKDSLKKRQKVPRYITALILGGVGALTVLGYGALELHLLGPSIGVVTAAAVIWIFTILMKQRTKKSAELLGRILGFKEFIRTAELDRIKTLAEENPEYFYDVLPYAYAMGLSNVWAKKFESLAVEPPGWYYGAGGDFFNTWILMSALNRCTTTMQNTAIVPPETGSAGFGGGGFTGGGGFSGGGFGGGGGGGW